MDLLKNKIRLLIFAVSIIGACSTYGQSVQFDANALNWKAIQNKPRIETVKELKSAPLLIDFSKIDLQKNLEFKEDLREKIQGPGTGGGGNSCSLMISLNTKELLGYLAKIKGFADTPYIGRIEKTIKATQFRLGHDLMLNGKSVQAINYPSLKIIMVDERLCNSISQVTPRTMGIFLHEYLGLSKIDDSQYQVSRIFVNEVSKLMGYVSVTPSSSDIYIHLQGGVGSEAEKLYNSIQVKEDVAYYHHPEAQVFDKSTENVDCEKPGPDSGEELLYNCTVRINPK